MNITSVLLRTRLTYIELMADDLKKKLIEGQLTYEEVFHTLSIISLTARNAHADYVQQEGTSNQEIN